MHMHKAYLTNQTFDKSDFTRNPIPNADFEACCFTHSNFSDTDLSGYNFTDYIFEDCNISTARIVQTTFNEVVFRNCKMLGLHFETANEFLFTVSFENCNLNLCSFYQRKMKKNHI